GNLAFLRDLRFRFVALFLEPFYEIQRIEALTAGEDARALSQFVGRERALQQGHDTSDHERRRLPPPVQRQSDQGFQPFADDIGVRQLRIMRQALPGGVEEGLRVEGGSASVRPRRDVWSREAA